MRKFFSLFLVCFFMNFLFSSEFAWRKSKNNGILIWTDSDLEFYWSGNTLDGFANGNGTVEFYENGRKVSIIWGEYIYGANKNDFYNLNNTGDFYAGEGKGKGEQKLPNGKGVLLKANKNSYFGSFKNGKVDGYAVRFCDKTLIYKGDFKDNLYSGKGEYYDGGILFYKGDFLKGNREGDGTEYQNGFAISGKYKNDKKNGKFIISGKGITREVEFKDDVPNLDSCKITYSNGLQWIGALDKRYNPKNEGKVIYSNNDVYEGDIEKNTRSGFGSFSSDCVSYVGEWVNDKCSGFGEATFGENCFYSGNWKENVFDGFGVLTFGEYRYSGEWKDGQKSGYGTLSIGNSRFDGQFEEDRINGQGVMSYQNGDVYSGNWVNSRQEGYGEYFWADGSAYFGDWADDLQNGEGSLFLASGENYEGEFFDGKYCGNGVLNYKNGDRYEGQFKENQKNGVGVYYFTNGESYEGQFQSDTISGTGKFFFEDGSFYDGKFLDGRMCGKGSLFMPDGDEYVILTSDYWEGVEFPKRGTLIFPNGDEFVGALKDGKPTEKGIWRNSNNKSTEDKAYDFYKEHETSIKNVTSTTQLVLAGVSIGGTIVAAVTAVPCPPVAGVALAISKIADIANVSISGLSIAVGTGVMLKETNEARLMGDEEEVKRIQKEYLKEQIWNVADIALTFGSAAIKAARSGVVAKKATKIYPGIESAIKNSGIMADVAKSSKFTNKLIRSTVEVAYGNVGKSLVKEYGDDAARLLFKYGDNAIFALTKGGDATLKIAKKGGEKALKAVFTNGEGAINLISKNMNYADDIANLLAKHGKSGIKLAEEFGGNSSVFFKAYAKYGDDFFKVTRKLGKENRKTFAKFASNYGDDFFKIVSKTKNPTELNKTLKYLSVSGKEGIETVQKLGKIPQSVSIRSLKRAELIDFQRIANKVSSIRSKGKIVLSDADLAWIRKNPKVNLRATIRAKTNAKTFGEGFQEFFIRLSDGDSRQVKELMEIPEIKKTVNHAIRGGGGVHEWLMTKNYTDFLTNPKWGKDGASISLALTELVQDTRSVAFKNGGTHFDKMNSGKFHRGLADVIDSSENAKSLFANVRNYAESALTKESFEEFLGIFERCFCKV